MQIQFSWNSIYFNAFKLKPALDRYATPHIYTVYCIQYIYNSTETDIEYSVYDAVIYLFSPDSFIYKQLSQNI